MLLWRPILFYIWTFIDDESLGTNIIKEIHHEWAKDFSQIKLMLIMIYGYMWFLDIVFQDS